MANHESNFDQWVRQNDERVNGVAEKLREQFNTAILSARNANNAGGERYFQRCTTKCELQPGYGGKTQQELDSIAFDMTNQIITDLQTGKITRAQVNQPQWYEHRVAEKLAELERNFQQNVNVQHQQRFEQSSSQNHQQQQHNSFRTHALYPGRDWQVTSTLDQQNCTTDNHSPINLLNQLNSRHDKESEVVVQTHGATVPVYGGSYFKQNQFQESHQSSSTGAVVRPIINPQSYHHSSIVQRNQTRNVPPVVISVPAPAQSSYIREEHEERRETASSRPIYIDGGSRTHQRTSNRFFESEVVPNYRPRVVLDNSVLKELEVHNSHIKTTNYVPPPPVTTTTIHKEEKHEMRSKNVAPVIYLPSRTQSVTREEKRVENNVKHRPIYRPTIQETISKHEEERHENRVQEQQPIYRPIQSHSTQHIVDESRRESRTHQLPVFSHHSFSKVEDSTNQSSSNSQQQYQVGGGGGRTTSTVKETTFVQVSPEIQYITEYTEEEYLERLQHAQQELQRLGYGVLSEREYNATIAAGGFIHNGYKYLYNDGTGRFEKSERAEVTVHEHHNQLQQLQQQLIQYGFSQMTEEEFNETITTGQFIRNGERYNYNAETGHIFKSDITQHEYERRYDRIYQELQRLGLRTLTESEFNQTITSNNIYIDGVHYTFNTQTGRLDREHGFETQEQQVNIAEHEYRTTLRRLQELLTRLGFNQMTEREYNETISTGTFVRAGNRYRLNTYTGNFEKVEISQEEYNVILNRLRETLTRLGYRQMTKSETNETISTGTFIRGGYQWNYNSETGEANRIRVAAPFEELSESEYLEMYRRLQDTLVELGYERISSSECNETITRGSLERGGNQWIYQADNGQWEHVELSAEEFQFRLARLVEILTHLKITRDEHEKRDIINRSNFYHAGHRYEYNTRTSIFERLTLTEAQYQERVRRLLEQLQKIGYGTMTDGQCRQTIDTGVFYYGGYEWNYNHRSGWYEMGARSDKEGFANVPSTADYDSTKYDSTKKEEERKRTAAANSNKRPKDIISKNRGDQPPQTFEEDYDESEEIIEPEPGITPAKPLPRPRPTQAPLQPPPVTVPAAYPSHDERHERYENRRTENLVSMVPVPTQQTEYKKSYHRKETVYTQTLVTETIHINISFVCQHN